MSSSSRRRRHLSSSSVKNLTLAPTPIPAVTEVPEATSAPRERSRTHFTPLDRYNRLVPPPRVERPRIDRIISDPIQDLRRWNPNPLHLLRKINYKLSKKVLDKIPDFPYFNLNRNGKIHPVCRARKLRRKVLFVKRIAGGSGVSRRHKFSLKSFVRC